MAATETMTFRMTPETKRQLETIAQETRRSKAFLAAEAVAAYARHEIEIIEGIKRGMADVEAGRVVPHDEAMAQIDAVIAAAEAAAKS